MQQQVFKQYKIIRTRKLANHTRKMGVRVNVRISKIVRTLIKVGVRKYATYVNCRTLSVHQAGFVVQQAPGYQRSIKFMQGKVCPAQCFITRPVLHNSVVFYISLCFLLHPFFGNLFFLFRHVVPESQHFMGSLLGDIF